MVVNTEEINNEYYKLVRQAYAIKHIGLLQVARAKANGNMDAKVSEDQIDLFFKSNPSRAAWYMRARNVLEADGYVNEYGDLTMGVEDGQDSGEAW